MRNILFLILFFVVSVSVGATYLSGDAVRNPARTKIWTMPTISGSSDTLVSLTSSSVLTNKTLTTPIISSISNTGTLTLPTSTDTLVGLATTDVLTNKTLTAPKITSLSAGSVLFGGSSNVVTQDQAGINYDDTNNALMMGTTTYRGRVAQNFGLDTSANFGGMFLTTWSATASNAPTLDFNRSKSASVGTMTSVAASDLLGYISFRGADGSAFRDASAIVAGVDGTPGASDMPGYLSFQTVPDNATNLAERMNITNAGRVKVNSVHNNAGGCGASSTVGEICSGTYTPTLTGVSNVAAVTVGNARYIRVGNIVTMMIQMSVDPTSAAATTNVGISLPIASGFTASSQAEGLCNSDDDQTRCYAFADDVNDRIQLSFIPSGAGNSANHSIIQYEVK